MESEELFRLFASRFCAGKVTAKFRKVDSLQDAEYAAIVFGSDTEAETRAEELYVAQLHPFEIVYHDFGTGYTLCNGDQSKRYAGIHLKTFVMSRSRVERGGLYFPHSRYFRRRVGGKLVQLDDRWIGETPSGLSGETFFSLTFPRRVEIERIDRADFSPVGKRFLTSNKQFRTVGDLIEHLAEHRYFSQRDCGEKTVAEIMGYLSDKGVTVHKPVY